MQPIRTPYLLFGALTLTALASCSLHRYQGPDDQLYIGVKSIDVVGKAQGGYLGDALAEAETKLSYAPNGSILGSNSLRFPFPLVSPYLYMSLSSHPTWLTKGLRRLTSRPVWMRDVSPTLRAKVAQQALRDRGYLSAQVRASIHPLPSDSLQAKVSYEITPGALYLLDSVSYFPPVPIRKDRFFRHERLSYLHRGGPFSMQALQADRDIATAFLREHGYYYLKSDYITYEADTLQKPGHVALRTRLAPDTPSEALRQWRVGDIQLRLLPDDNERLGSLATDSVGLGPGLKFYYTDKPLVRPRMLASRIRMTPQAIYKSSEEASTLAALNNLGAFSSVEFYFSKREETKGDASADSTASDSLRRSFPSVMDSIGDLDLMVLLRPSRPWSAYIGAAMMKKSNNYMGPGVSLSLDRNNLFGGGERLSANLYGSYEWQTGRSPSDGSSVSINSYQLGGDLSLVFPTILFPSMLDSYYKYPTSTSFKLGAQAINHARYYTLRSLSLSMEYSFQPSERWSHRLVPLSLSYTQLSHTTARFDKLLEENPALGLSLRNQFIPKLAYYFTYTHQPEQSPHFLQLFGEVSEAGNVVNALESLSGRPYGETKKLFGVPFAQFVKAALDMRYSWRIDRNQTIATRLATGALYAYGNATTAPYIEQFYVGGANSIRAFTVRSIGPGRFRTEDENAYSFMDRVGEFKFEANLEYRGRLFGDCHAAVFLDAGNVWLLRPDASRPGAALSEAGSLSRLLDQIAVGTGAGLRYDLSFLVVRFDVGIGLHLPYATERRGWYNIPRFKDAIGYHLAIGYPF